MFSLASEEMVLFVDLREGRRYLWDPADKDYKNYGALGTPVVSKAEASNNLILD